MWRVSILDAPLLSDAASAGPMGVRSAEQIAQLTADLEAEKRRRIAAEENASSDKDNSQPVSPTVSKQYELLKKRNAELEAELMTANTRRSAGSVVSHATPPPSTLGDWHGTDASAAEYYQYQYSSASDNVAVLALLVQEAVRAHSWTAGVNSRKVLHYGQPHGGDPGGRLRISYLFSSSLTCDHHRPLSWPVTSESVVYTFCARFLFF